MFCFQKKEDDSLVAIYRREKMRTLHVILEDSFRLKRFEKHLETYKKDHCFDYKRRHTNTHIDKIFPHQKKSFKIFSFKGSNVKKKKLKQLYICLFVDNGLIITRFIRNREVKFHQ